MRLLIVNPNTSSATTALLQRHVAGAAGAHVMVEATTARFGASYIADETSYAVAAHAALDAYAVHAEAHGEPDAVLLACFGDPGVEALRQLSRRPVIGLAEASMREATGLGMFAVVTGGRAWGPMLERIARSWGFGGALARVHTVEPSGAELAADVDAAASLLGAACREAAVGVQAVILGGAALAGLAGRIERSASVALIDSVAAGTRAIVRMARADDRQMRTTRAAAAWTGVSDALSRRLG
ncbi:aspartate/glutamate racemase family protein [Piscinibacter sp. XHJ-5]|uniref:aspartate/glutamate racemase family protein n=1 Tax=Piscinibacter sp. XHJ-5 TaxID=3037797 RepID=UPI0024528D62|nr:aspartate/glutamate racemase family protein [Piscinibacter sp. XHJ-5]